MAPNLHNEDLVGMLCEMIKARIASDRLWSLQRQGRIGTIAPINGQEATTVGASWALDPAHDWVLPQYREPMGLGRYGPEILNRFAAWAIGHPEGGHIPDPIRVFPPQISLATQILHAVGMAWALKMQKAPGVALTFFGDGSTSEGDFYEAANFAGVLDAPVIIVVVNNGWAISTPITSQTRAKNFAEKSHAFGIPGVTVDGTDALAMFEAVADARNRAVAGAGPTLIEAVTYRLGPHTTADDPTRYVPSDELASARERDPIVVIRSEMQRRNLWSQDFEDQILATADARMERAVVAAEARPLEPAELFNHVYDEPTPRLARQRTEFEAK